MENSLSEFNQLLKKKGICKFIMNTIMRTDPDFTIRDMGNLEIIELRINALLN